MNSVERFKAHCLAGRWYREKFGLQAPQSLGLEIRDEDTGDWSFMLVGYGFIYKILHTWAGHFANALQMATLLKALSESRHLCYPGFKGFCVNNVPEEFAEAFGLPFSPLYYNPIYFPLVRLPITPDHPFKYDNKIRLLGLGSAGSTTRQ